MGDHVAHDVSVGMESQLLSRDSKRRTFRTLS